ncbi:MAG: hypothetical protein M1378_11925 [Bacteroidetes bacterium]|nr:hypothetical protein [Bacteroidota bacterium]
MITLMKRRYVRQNFNSKFGYYIGFSIREVQETRELKNVVPAFLGRPDLVSKSQITDLPLAWNSEEAKQLFEEKKEFAFLGRGTDGRIFAGVMEKDDYEYRCLFLKDKEPNFDGIIDAVQYVREHKL